MKKSTYTILATYMTKTTLFRITSKRNKQNKNTAAAKYIRNQALDKVIDLWHDISLPLTCKKRLKLEQKANLGY